MTLPARLTQADIERAAKAAKSAGIENFRLVISYQNQQIEVIVGTQSQQNDVNPFDEV